MRMMLAGFIVAIGASVGHGSAALTQSEASREPVTKEQFERWMTELSNWGRWGKEDQLGAANLVTPDKRRKAAALVKTGMTVSLGHDVIMEKASDAPDPYVLKMTVNPDRQNAMDRFDIDYHGGTFTHLDALCHVAYKDKLYNGFEFQQTVTTGGCSKMGITALKDGLVTRGVLIDIPRLKGVTYLEPGTHVYRDEIEAWEKQAGIRVGPGDALLLRTGRWARRAALGPARSSGFDTSFLPFLKDRDVALLGGDSAHETGPVAGVTLPSGGSYPVIHRFAIVARGMNLLDNLDLETLAETAARLKRWEFMLIVAPPRVPGGTGSPINPIAIF
jgi:kynurenine formamidase